ncbi:hypothetical protein NGRA_0546 [Nosema granulosis]|uniref:Uncharacterized protein n=1 Tax=Nosema granulosis TaxID=83296 RepID=A0A9P6H066_9MICR|nr:hypothetical protein NGRA_0546 [Nosema granulosis]
MDLFDKPVYVFGKIVKKKLVTPYKSWEIDLDLKADFLPVKILGEKVEIFSKNRIFNSYVLSEEENLRTLFSVDSKLTVTGEEVEKGRIYTFVVEKEDDLVRRVSLFKFDCLYPGTRTVGRVLKKKNKLVVSTIYGEGELVLQNNTYGKKIEVLLYRKDETLHFVQVDCPVESKVSLKVDSYSSGYYTVSDRNIRGILFSKSKYKVGDTVECIPKDNNLGFYIFKENDTKKDTNDTKKDTNDTKKDTNDTKKDTKDTKNDTKDTKNDTKDTKNDTMKDTKNDTPITPTVPFDIPTDNEDSTSSTTANINVDLSLERKRSKISTDEDYFMEIKARPGKALPILKYFQFLVESSKIEEAKRVFWEYSSSLTGREKDDLSIAFVNFLIYSSEKDLLKTVKKLSKTCSEKFLRVVSSNTDDLSIVKLYYSTSPNRLSFRRYLEVLFTANPKEAYSLVEANPKYLDISIPFLYSYKDSPRIRIESLISKNKEAWLEYLKNESGDYKRHLFRRVVDLNWNQKEMKEFYKLWLDFEIQENGNIEEVRNRAKEYVSKLNSTLQKNED